MDLQTRRSLVGLGIACVVLLAPPGCATKLEGRRADYSLVAVGAEGSSVRLYRSAHHLLYTTLADDYRVGTIVATLEASHAACVELTGIRPESGATPQSAFVFERKAEWEAFTRSRAGALAPIYLKLDRGGYTLEKVCVVRDQGERDTLTVLSHEEFHLFIANRFIARPPPFLEEGLATLLETVRETDGTARIDIGKSGARGVKIAMLADARALVPLRVLLSMHAGNVVGLDGAEVDAFYAQAWAFARFLREGERGRYRPALMQLLSDAATGALSSESMSEDPALMERYLGTSLETLDVAYAKFARTLE